MDPALIGAFELPPRYAHMIILHEKLLSRDSDRYILNLGLAFEKIGYKVTILTSQFKQEQCPNDLEFLDKIAVHFSGWWIPGNLLGFCSDFMSGLKSALMAFRLIFIPPKPRPQIVLLDGSLIAVFILKKLTSYKVFYVENFAKLKAEERYYNPADVPVPSNSMPSKWINIADEVIVETNGFEEILVNTNRIAPMIKISVLYPPIDMGLWNNIDQSMQQTNPSLSSHFIWFLTVGKYKQSSNFRLAIEAFAVFLNLIDDVVAKKKFQLLIAGNCKSPKEKRYLNEMISLAKEKRCSHQVNFFEKISLAREKRMIIESTIIIHPAKYDITSDFLLKAMSIGKPILATNRGLASKLLIHRISGVIVEPDPRIFAIALKKLTKSPHLQFFLGDMARDTHRRCCSFESLCENAKKMVIKHFPVVTCVVRNTPRRYGKMGQ